MEPWALGDPESENSSCLVAHLDFRPEEHSLALSACSGPLAREFHTCVSSSVRAATGSRISDDLQSGWLVVVSQSVFCPHACLGAGRLSYLVRVLVSTGLLA